MKKAALLTAIIFLSIFTKAQVQRNVTKRSKADTAFNSPGQPVIQDDKKADRRKMLRELDLSKDQRIKMKEIRQNALASQEAVTNDDKLDQSQKEAKLRQLKKEQALKMQSVLNDEQKVKMKNMRGEMRKQKQKEIKASDQ